MIRILRMAWDELVGMFIDDGSLAVLSLILVAVIAVSVRWLALPPLPGAILLLAGCLAILGYSVFRATRR